MADLTAMSSLEIADMGPRRIFATNLASLPREVRDMVYRYVFSDRMYAVGFGSRYFIVSPGNKVLDNFLITIHEEAFRSRVARELCQAFWSVKLSQQTLDLNLVQLPDLLNPSLVTIMETSDTESERTTYGVQPTLRTPLISTVRPRDFVADLEININDNKELNLVKESDLRKLGQGLALVLRFPRLRRVELNLWVPRNCNCYRVAMQLIESISSTCKALQRRICGKLSVWIMRDWPHHRSTFKFMDHDISWMWEKPGQEIRMIRGTRSPTVAENHVRTLTGIDSDLNRSQRAWLQELRETASSLPRRREDIAAEKGGWKEKD